jgi:hypothetical protein
MVLFVATEEPLEILKPLQDQEIMETQTATLTCEVSKPDVPAKWLKERKEISHGGRYEYHAKYLC